MSRVALIFERFDPVSPVLRILTARVEKLGIETLGAVLACRGHEVTVIDNELEGMPAASLAASLNDGGFDIVGFSLNSGNVDSTLALARQIGPGPLVVFGGVAASLHPSQVFEECPRADVVVVGEGETPLSLLADGLREVPGTVTRDSQVPVPMPPVDLDSLPPLPHRRLESYQQPTISTSRGCRFACDYCAESRFLREARVRWHGCSAERVIEELRRLAQRSSGNVWIVDGDFIGPQPERAAAIAQGILREGPALRFEMDARAADVEEDLFRLLRDAGLGRVFIGVESLSTNFLRRVRKAVQPVEVYRALAILKRLGIGFTIGMIPFSEEATLEELAADVRFMEEQGFENLGSDLFSGLKHYDGLRARIPSRFVDERVARVFADFRAFEKRLAWCYGARVQSCRTAIERQQLVYEINNAVGLELKRLVEAELG